MLEQLNLEAIFALTFAYFVWLGVIIILPFVIVTFPALIYGIYKKRFRKIDAFFILISLLLCLGSMEVFYYLSELNYWHTRISLDQIGIVSYFFAGCASILFYIQAFRQQRIPYFFAYLVGIPFTATTIFIYFYFVFFNLS